MVSPISKSESMFSFSTVQTEKNLWKKLVKKCDEFVTNNKTTLTTSGLWGTQNKQNENTRENTNLLTRRPPQARQHRQ